VQPGREHGQDAPNASVTQNRPDRRVRCVWRISSCWSSGGLLLKKFIPVK
jgi:hypothetical protein